MNHRKITIIPILSMVFIGFFLTININLLAPRSSISNTLNFSTSGDVWFSSVPTQSIGDTFEIEIYIDTGSQNLAAYGINIAYNQDVIKIASDNDVVAGDQGFVSAVNIDNENGLVIIAGFEAVGTGPSSQLHLLTITWTAVGEGSSSLDLSIMDLADNLIIPIDTPNDIDSSVEVEGGSVQAPVIDSPPNVFYQSGETGNFINWTATDDNPTTYTVTRDGIQLITDSWSSGNPIIINVDGLLEGIYTFICTVYDGDGIFDSDSVTVTVGLPPGGDVWFSSVLIQPVGSFFETEIYVDTGTQNLGAYEFDIAYNENIIQISSDVDIVAGTNGFLDTVNIDNDNGLVTITGFDSMGKGPSSQLHLLTITWTAVGVGSTSLDLTIDNLIDTNNNIIGTPNAIDGMIDVKEGPIQAPVLNSPADVNYQQGTIGHSINWTATDDNPYLYRITRNGHQVGYDFWTSANPITKNIDGLGEGSYIYTITVYDRDELSDSDSVIVTVGPPDGGNVWFSSVPTQTVGDTFETEIYVDTGHQNLEYYYFNITYNKDVIQIASNGDIIAAPDGFLHNPVIDNDNGWVIISGFDNEAYKKDPNPQLHLFTIIWTAVGEGYSLLDLSIIWLSDSRNIGVGVPNDIDSNVEVGEAHLQAPIINYPSNINYKAGETGNSIIWIATDDNPTTYTITRNETQIDSGLWSSGNPIIINVDGLSPGIYTYTCTVIDGDELIDSNSVNVLVYPANESSGGEIPGYNLIVFLGSFWMMILAMVYLMKRRQ